VPFAPRWGGTPIRHLTRKFRPGFLESSGLPLVLALRVGCRCCWFSFSSLVQKGSPPLFSGPPNLLGSAGLLLAGWCPRPRSLMQAQRQQPLKRSADAGLDRCPEPNEELLMMRYMRYGARWLY